MPAAICVAVFLIGIVAAMVVTQHLRSEGPTATHIRLRYKPSAPARVCFKTPRDDTFEVGMVDSEDQLVRVLARGERLNGDAALGHDSKHCFNWDGRDEQGDPAPPGAYRLRLSLRDADRSSISGERLTIPERGAGEQG